MNKVTRRPKVCQVLRHSEIAGTEKHVYLLATHLDRDTYKTHVCIFEEGELAERLRNENIQVTVIPGDHSIIHFLRLVVFFARNNFDVIHCHSGGYACLAARAAGMRRVVYTKHGIGFTAEELKCRSFFRKLRDFIVDRCVAKYITLTSYDKHIMIHVLHVGEGKILVIHNGIDPSFGEIGFPLEKQHPTIGVVGRLTAQKGIFYLISAIPIIAEKHKDIKVLIVGTGEEELVLRDLAEKIGVLEKIEFLGYVGDVAPVMSSMDIFVLPSVWEGFPYVLLEAMLLRKPVVATNIFGVNEIIEHNKSGILVKPQDPAGIAHAIDTLLSDKQMASRIGNNGYQRVLSHFTLNKTLSKIEQAYMSLMQAAPGNNY